MAKDHSSFSSLRAYLLPVHGYELKKFFSLLLMAFFIGFNYNILRNMKDALLVTAENSGAEVLPFIKVWGIVPGAFFLTFIYSRLNNKFSRDKVFYLMICIFLVFFAVFTFVIYPLHQSFHLDFLANKLELLLPKGFKGLISMIRYWTFSSFYIMSELWSSAILSMLFWGFANEVTPLNQAKRFYGLIAIGMNASAITAGQISFFLTKGSWTSLIFWSKNNWHQSIVLLTMVIILSGCVIMGIYAYLTKYILPQVERNYSPPKKMMMSMRENFRYLSQSKYLISIAVIVLSYNIVINLVEVIWKDQVRNLYPNPCDFNAYMSQITTITGIVSCILSIFVSSQAIRKFGWTPAALATPVILLITSIGFFTFFFGKESFFGILSSLGTSPLALVVFFGSAQNCLSRGVKFTLFDATKEIAFIPLSREAKLKGKAAIDGIGSRIGKSGGSIIHQVLLILYSTVSASAHVITVILAVVIFFWIAMTRSLGRKFNTLSQDKHAYDTLETTEEEKAEETVATV